MDIFSNYFIVTSFISALLLLLWKYLKENRKQRYFEKMGVKYLKINPIKEFYEEMFKNQPIHEGLRKLYYSMPPIYGMWKGGYPTLSVADPAIIKNVLVKDFHIFTNRRVFRFGDPITDSFLFSLEDDDWKRVRSILTPTFSSAKFKALFSNFKSCSKTLVQNIRYGADKNQAINVSKIFSGFAMDLATSSLFSVKMDSLDYQENKLVKLVEKTSNSISLRLALFNFFPGLMKFFNVQFFDPAKTEYFTEIASRLIEERKRKKEKRNDFLQHLIDYMEEKDDTSTNLKDKEDSTNNSTEETSNEQKNTVKLSRKTLTMNEVVAQCGLFVRAGSSTSGLTLATASYLLALHEDVQNKAREEISRCMKEANGELTYEALQEMKYIDYLINEVLRVYPLAALVERRADADYELGDTGITIKKGTIISIPLYGIHHDPKHFPNPDKFDPNRFTVEEKAKRDPYTYLPFGLGPRNCIGMRFTQVQLKLGLVYTIRCFKIKISPQTKIPLQFKKGSEFIRPKDIFLTLEPTPECDIVLSEE